MKMIGKIRGTWLRHLPVGLLAAAALPGLIGFVGGLATAGAHPGGTDVATVAWKGTWVNEYGSRLHITEDEDGRIAGTFTTALGDSSFAGATLPIIGLSKGNALHFALASPQEPVTVTAFTGLLRADTLHMAWLMVSDKAIKAPRPGAEPTEIELPWAHAVQVNTDSFHRDA